MLCLAIKDCTLTEMLVISGLAGFKLQSIAKSEIQVYQWFDEYIRQSSRRLFFDEMPEYVVGKIINFFRDNQILIACNVLKGRGALSADWLMVARYDKQRNRTDFAIADINVAINFFGSGEVRVSPKGSLYVGKITMQRKGGTPEPTKLQFKIKPCQIFELEEVQ